MKAVITLCALCVMLMMSYAYAGGIYSSIESKGEDYGDIYSSRGNRDVYTTEDKRGGLYTTRDDGSIYSTTDKREGLYTTHEPTPAPNGIDSGRGVQGSDLKDGYVW